MFEPVLCGPPYDLLIEDDPSDPTLLISVEIAHDEVTARTVYVETRLADALIDGLECCEFSFQIAVVSLDGSSEDFATQDRGLAYPFIPAAIRDRVMDVICASYRSLMERRRPSLIYRVVKEPDLPEKALAKHRALTRVVEDCGYALCESGTDYWGRSYWLFAYMND